MAHVWLFPSGLITVGDGGRCFSLLQPIDWLTVAVLGTSDVQHQKDIGGLLIYPLPGHLMAKQPAWCWAPT